MAWFDQKETGRPAPAHFDDVTQHRRRQPSWLCRSGQQSAPAPVSLPRPPAIPSEVSNALPQQVALPSAELPRQFKPDAPEASGIPAAEASRPSMSPAELETLVAERAIRQALEQTLETGRTAVTEALNRIEEVHDQLVTQLTSRAVELAMLVARRVIARELRTEKEIVVSLVQEALDVLNSRDRVRVHLASEIALMQNALDAHYSAMGTLIDVVIDDSLPGYGCLVETDVGSVDESIDSRLSALLEAVAGNEGE